MSRSRAVSGTILLLEVFFSAFVTALTSVAILGGYVANIRLANMTMNRVHHTIATNAFIEQLRQTPYSTLLDKAEAHTTEVALATPGQAELLVTYQPVIEAGATIAVDVTLDPMWRETDNRVIGEDANLNGSLEADEDRNDNGRLDSPFELTMRMAPRLET